MLAALLACSAPDNAPAPPDRDEPEASPSVIAGTVTGALVGRTDVVVAAIDASAYRFGDAIDVSTLVSWDAATGAFRIELDPAAPITDLYAKAFVAAWVDLDADGRYDARTEALCDQPADGSPVVYLTLLEGAGWALGIRREHEGEVGLHYAPTLDGDACSTH